MNMHDFDKLTSNVEVMQLIFQLLDFEEQLIFAQVSLQLKHIFINYVWRVDYTKICIIKHKPNYHVKNDSNMNRLKLSSTEFAEFLKVYGSDIKELNEKCDPWMDIRKFSNLTSLSYSNMTVTKPQLQNVAKHCKNLQYLTLNTCTNKDKDMFELGRDLEIKTILEMKNLKYLNLASCIRLPLKYRRFLELVIKSQIKHLILFYYIESDETLSLFNKTTANSLEELQISTTFNEKWYGKNFPSYLSLFENLYILRLNDNDDIDNETIKILANTCKRLKEFCISYTTFNNVSNFNLLTSVESLSISSCEGLTYTNLKQILTEMNLQRFHSDQTDYEGEFIDFPLTNNLQHLNISPLKTYRFKGAYEHNNTLTSLAWHDDYYGPATEPRILQCPNLKSLSIESGFITLELILQLCSLHSLAIAHPADNLTWSFITTLLRDHVSLKKFTIENLCYGLEEEQEDSVPKEAFECAPHLKCITITSEVFEMAIDFWLDLLSQNPQLTLKCCGLFNRDFVLNIIKSPKFPTSLAVLYIHGFKVACKDLRKNFDYIMDKVDRDTHLPTEAAYDNEYEIIF